MAGTSFKQSDNIYLPDKHLATFNCTKQMFIFLLYLDNYMILLWLLILSIYIYRCNIKTHTILYAPQAPGYREKYSSAPKGYYVVYFSLKASSLLKQANFFSQFSTVIIMLVVINLNKELNLHRNF